jgi:hypothetical protein
VEAWGWAAATGVPWGLSYIFRRRLQGRAGERLTAHRRRFRSWECEEATLAMLSPLSRAARILRSFAAIPQFPAGSCGRAPVVIDVSI